ncbi:MAG TPA: hypothetical protein VNV42_00980 [Solirubrobacteraceae bacterium]|jgi:hypothetical protein|nr:hypothetical protein [Solirubrobacteraceae bacterium]
MADTRAAPVVPVLFDEHAIADDLAHHPPVACTALEQFRREVDHAGGLPLARLRSCEAEGHDGTRLGGCVKTYVPWPSGHFGLVMLAVAHPTRSFALRAFAYGVRHPAPTKPSVYAIAHQRYNKESA